VASEPFDSILVPLDGSELSEQALPYALAIVRDSGTVTLLQSLPEAEPLRKPLGGIAMTAEEVEQMLTKLAQADLDRANEHWGALAPGVKVKSKVVSGDAASVILETADAEGVDLIAMASAGRGAIGRLTLGSVADRVIRAAEKPVLVIREYDAPAGSELPRLERVVVPLDGSDRALLAVPVAAAAAAKLGLAVDLLSAVDLPQVVSPAIAYGPAFTPEFYSEIEAEATTNADSYLDEAIAQFADRGIEARKHVMIGSAVAAILDFVQYGDMIVMTSRGQGGFKRWVLGSVAEKLIRESSVPVVLVPSHHHE
jgi:nucleotide-binding universal stress UspA family protein